jgi:hypothetical protein
VREFLIISVLVIVLLYLPYRIQERRAEKKRREEAGK